MFKSFFVLSCLILTSFSSAKSNLPIKDIQIDYMNKPEFLVVYNGGLSVSIRLINELPAIPKTNLEKLLFTEKEKSVISYKMTELPENDFIEGQIITWLDFASGKVQTFKFGKEISIRLLQNLVYDPGDGAIDRKYFYESYYYLLDPKADSSSEYNGEIASGIAYKGVDPNFVGGKEEIASFSGVVLDEEPISFMIDKEKYENDKTGILEIKKFETSGLAFYRISRELVKGEEQSGSIENRYKAYLVMNKTIYDVSELWASKGSSEMKFSFGQWFKGPLVSLSLRNDYENCISLVKIFNNRIEVYPMKCRDKFEC